MTRLIDLSKMKLRLRNAPLSILDGALGTELIARGLDVRADIAERWVLERPEVLEEIHGAYLAAGASAVQTCSFGALRARLERHGLAERVYEIAERSVALARKAGLPVIGSIGPTGLVRSIEGGNDPALARVIEAQVAEAADGLAQADAICLETQYHPAELTAAAAGVRRSSPHLPLWISITVVTGDAGLVTPHGVSFDRMLRALADAAPDAVGVNCSLDAERIRPAVEKLVAAGIAPVFARPQARVSEKCATGRSNETPGRFATHAVRLFAAGAAAVGGCCGTHPGSIAALAEALRVADNLQEVAR